MKLSSEVIQELVRLRAKKKEFEAQEKELCDSIKEKMREEKIEEFAPKDSPFMLQFQIVETTLFSWEDTAKELLKDTYGKKWNKELALRRKAAGTESRERLLVPANPKYRGEK